MKYLFINTAVSVSTIALIENDSIVSICEEYNSNDLSAKIFFMIDKVFEDGKCQPKDLNKIFVVNGPGSFTGIRIGLAIAKTMAWSLNIDLIPVSCLECLASSSSGEDMIALIDARRDFVYAGRYDTELKEKMPDQYIKIDQLIKDFSKSKIKYVSYDIFSSIQTEKPNPDYIKIIRKHLSDKVISCHKVNPNYLKMTEAEEKRIQNEH